MPAFGTQAPRLPFSGIPATDGGFHIAPGTRAKRIGALHGGGNAVVSVLFIASWLMRSANQPPPNDAIAVGVVGALIALFTAWLGGELVGRLGVGVYDGANLDAPSSLDDRHQHVEHRPTH
jgi:uncharacterized membrane protein